MDKHNLNINLEQAFHLKRFFLIIFSIIDYLDIKKILIHTTDHSYSTHRALLYVGFDYNELLKSYSLETI